MGKVAIVEVIWKKNVFDAYGDSVLKSIRDLGIKSVLDVKTTKLYKFISELNKNELHKICTELLIDRVTQEFVIHFGERCMASKEGAEITVIEVWLKKGVTDAVGESVKKAIKDMGINKNVEVHTGDKYIISGALKESEKKLIATRLLANEVIQEYNIF
jgi:phosphoribosylformylglycinamidine (FGAM) synthase PurS component